MNLGNIPDWYFIVDTDHKWTIVVRMLDGKYGYAFDEAHDTEQAQRLSQTLTLTSSVAEFCEEYGYAGPISVRIIARELMYQREKYQPNYEEELTLA